MRKVQGMMAESAQLQNWWQVLIQPPDRGAWICLSWKKCGSAQRCFKWRKSVGLYLLISRATPPVMNLTPQCWNIQTSPLADSRIGQLRVLRSCSFCWCHMFNQSPWSHKFLVHVPKTYRNQNPQESMWRSSKDWPKRSGCTFLFLFRIGQNKNLNYQLIAPAVLQEILSRQIA